jgi:hypothetical protein
MRITVMTNMAKSVRPPPPDPGFPAAQPVDLAGEVGAGLQRLKWFCWHGNVFRARQTVENITFDLDVEHPNIKQAKLLQAVREFDAYLRTNAGRIPNYGERRRAGEAISTAFTESAVNQVISKRMVKKQQMRWTPRGEPPPKCVALVVRDAGRGEILVTGDQDLQTPCWSVDEPAGWGAAQFGAECSAERARRGVSHPSRNSAGGDVGGEESQRLKHAQSAAPLSDRHAGVGAKRSFQAPAADARPAGQDVHG